MKLNWDGSDAGFWQASGQYAVYFVVNQQDGTYRADIIGMFGDKEDKYITDCGSDDAKAWCEQYEENYL